MLPISYAHALYLGSKSSSRKMLLDQAKIPYKILDQNADESECDWSLPLEKVVQSIALHKMHQVILPQGKQGDNIFVLTADTLSQDLDGTIQGKPLDKADAIDKIKKARNGSRLATAFCIDKKTFNNGAWQAEKQIARVVTAEYHFIIPDQWIDIYFEHTNPLLCANAIAVEEFGAQFLKVVHGSYSTIIGLPMFELREALEEIGFFG